MRKITEADILPQPEYMKARAQRRAAITALKKNRRLEVGPFATFYFESFDTMLHQVQEMLYIEKGGAEQLPDELAAYNPLIPDGRELTGLGGIEHTMFIRFAGETVKGAAEDDHERTRADGKASSVQFVHFPFTAAQIEKFRAAGTEVVVGFNHENYGHMALMAEPVRAALAKDFD
jgi:hypothetical protein